MVKGTLHIFQFIARVLIYSSSTHSFISYDFASLLGIKPQLLDCRLSVATPMGDHIVVNFVCRSCVI